MHTRMEAPAKSLIKRICSDTPSKLNVPAINWGRDKESVARGDYLLDMSSRHQDMEVIEAGLRISKASPYLAVSPDGIVKCTCHGSGVLEIKCPFSFKDATHEEMVREKASYLDKDFNLKKDHRYYGQVQMQVTGANTLASVCGCHQGARCAACCQTPTSWQTRYLSWPCFGANTCCPNC